MHSKAVTCSSHPADFVICTLGHLATKACPRLLYWLQMGGWVTSTSERNIHAQQGRHLQ